MRVVCAQHNAPRGLHLRTHWVITHAEPPRALNEGYRPVNRSLRSHAVHRMGPSGSDLHGKGRASHHPSVASTPLPTQRDLQRVTAVAQWDSSS